VESTGCKSLFPAVFAFVVIGTIPRECDTIVITAIKETRLHSRDSLKPGSHSTDTGNRKIAAPEDVLEGGVFCARDAFRPLGHLKKKVDVIEAIIVIGAIIYGNC
jgi:hypothetical protein